MSDFMITKLPTVHFSAVPPMQAGIVRRPRAYLARALFPLLVLTVIVLPGFAFGAPCPPGNLDCPAPPPVLIVPDCSTPPGLTTAPEAPTALLALPDSIVPAADGGQLLPGMGSVSATGEYEYRIPIDVPAGRAGMQPSLALAYGSRGRNGHVGVGWRLEGLSEINRCAKNFATDGYADGVHLDKTDSFCLDGHKLIAISGNYGEEGTEYRTEDDTFARIRSHVTSGVGVTSFSVETRDGRVRTYAPPPSAPPGKTIVVVAWPIQEEHDRSGNSILYSYFGTACVEQPTRDVEYYPSRIDYNTIALNDDKKSGPRNAQFLYEDRLDKTSLYVSNAQVHISQRLKSVLLSAPNPVTSNIVWRYDLTYEPGAASGASLLMKVQRCSVQHDGTKGSCFSAKQFTWNDNIRGPEYTTETFPDYSPQDAISLVGDFSGNGRSSVLRGDTIKLRETVDPSHPLSRELNCQGLLPGTDLYNAKLVDIYGDGRTRILAPVDVGLFYYYFIIDVDRVQSSNPNDPAVCELSYNSYVVGETGGFGSSCLHVTDLNGDGLPDLIKGEEDNAGPTFWNWYYRLNAPQANPQLTWVFGPKHSAPGHSPPAQRNVPVSTYIEYKSFSRDDGNHRGVIFPAAEPHYANLAGFGLMADGSVYGASPLSGIPYGYHDWGSSVGGDAAGYADTDGDGVRNVVYFSDYIVYFEREFLLIDWHGLDHGDMTEWYLEIADLDSDGRDDLMLVHKSDRKVLLFQADAQGTIHESLAPFLAPSAIGDFDGDGLLDLLVKSDTGQSSVSVTVYHQTGVGTTDRIVAVNNEGDPGDTDPSAREAIIYSNTQFADVGATCKYPQRCMRQGFAVVREHDVYQGADLAKSGPSARRHLYNYEDPRFDVRGRGFLGFGTVREWDADRGAETTTTYDNSTSDDNGIHLVYPGVLKPKTILSVVPMDVSAHPAHGNARLSRIEYRYQLVRLNQGQTYFVHPLMWDALDWEEEVAIDHGDAARIHITEIDGVTEKSALRQRQGSYHYDDYGNQLDAQVVTLHGVSTKTVSTYDNDHTNWLIGQLRTTDVTTSEYGQPAPLSQHKDYDYDTRGLLCHVYTEQNDSNPEIPQLVTFTHDSEGLVSAVTASAKGKPLRTIHMAYEPTERVYPSVTWNDLGQASWTLFDPARGVAMASEDANGLQAHYRYDDLGRMVQAMPEGQSSVELSYVPRTTASGAVIGTSSYSVMATGSESRTDRDTLGRTVGHGHKGFGGSWIEEATGYDLLGRPIFMTRPDINAPSHQGTEYAYDNLDRPLRKIVPGGGAVEYSHSFFTTMRSDTFTDRETVRDLDERVIYSVEDARNTRVTTSFVYGPFNQLDHVTDPAGNQITFTYDQRGRRSSISDPDAGTTIFHYNGFGDVISKTASGDLTTYFYDLLGRLRQTSHVSEVTFHTWDTHGAGRLAHTASPDGVEQDFKYNALGQLDTLTYTVDGENYDFQLAYDGLGRVINIAYPQVAGQSQRFSVGRAYNSWGYLAAVYDPSSFTYDPYWRVDGLNADDQLTNVTLGDHTAGTRYYDPDTGLLSGIVEGSSISLDYAYFLDGSLERRRDSLANRDERFEYDEFHRLKSWDVHNNPEVGYNYDELGNLTEVWSGAIGSIPATLLEKNTYAMNGKPHALTLGPQGAYTYDARGRQDTAPGRALVTYNERDLPKKITKVGGGDTLFEYDAGGARVKKQGLSETVITLSGLYERRTRDGHNQHVFYVPGGDDGPVARVVSEQGDPLANATTRYLHHDPLLGSVAAVTDASGTLTESLYYEPFGRRTNAQGSPLAVGSINVSIGFTGHEHDDDLELINMRGRVYDPTIRRFLSADPHVTDPLSGQSYNRYSYVVNNPINLTDPTGFDWWDFGSGGWISDGCVGYECGGGSSFSSSGFSFGFGGYSGSPSTGTPSGGNSGSTVAGGGYGVPVAASEEHREVSVPTGPAAPGVTISGPAVKPGAGGGHIYVYAGGDPTVDAPPPASFVATMATAAWNLKAVHAGDISPAGVVASSVRSLYDGVVVPVKNWAIDMHGDGPHRDHSEAMIGALGTVLLMAIMPGEGGAVEAVGPTVTRAQSLFHYTTEEGMEAILRTGELNPSLKALNPADARYGNGQYLTDIVPGTRSPGSLSSTFLRVPGQGSRFSHYVEINVSGLEVYEGRPGVSLVPNEGPLNVSDLIMSFGQAY